MGKGIFFRPKRLISADNLAFIIEEARQHPI
jgi:hypothetical protein